MAVVATQELEALQAGAFAVLRPVAPPGGPQLCAPPGRAADNGNGLGHSHLVLLLSPLSGQAWASTNDHLADITAILGGRGPRDETPLLLTGNPNTVERSSKDAQVRAKLLTQVGGRRTPSA
mmetsp:Transcript_6634/g.15892  ORF Transcript_6634/g.15892 Transcript_6634/m.15892 type:complete len:122 (+) Transcript_6634:217-582(+)